MMRFFAEEEYEIDPIFTDVPTTHWAYSYISLAHSYGFVQGYADGSFGPDRNIRRSEAVAIINRVLGREADKQFIRDHQQELSKLYPDVPETYWAFNYIVEASLDHDFNYEEGVEFWKNFKAPRK